MKFNERIRALREDSDKTQAELAKDLNTIQKKISRLETGECEPSLTDIRLLCEYYDLSADYILGYTDIPSPLPDK